MLNNLLANNQAKGSVLEGEGPSVEVQVRRMHGVDTDGIRPTLVFAPAYVGHRPIEIRPNVHGLGFTRTDAMVTNDLDKGLNPPPGLGRVQALNLRDLHVFDGVPDTKSYQYQNDSNGQNDNVYDDLNGTIKCSPLDVDEPKDSCEEQQNYHQSYNAHAR